MLSMTMPVVNPPVYKIVVFTRAKLLVGQPVLVAGEKNTEGVPEPIVPASPSIVMVKGCPKNGVDVLATIDFILLAAAPCAGETEMVLFVLATAEASAGPVGT